MKKILTMANLKKVATHLKSYPIRYALAIGVSTLFGLEATETTQLTEGLGTFATILESLTLVGF